MIIIEGADSSYIDRTEAFGVFAEARAKGGVMMPPTRDVISSKII